MEFGRELCAGLSVAGILALLHSHTSTAPSRLPGAEELVAPEPEPCEPLPIPSDVLFDTGNAELAVVSWFETWAEANGVDGWTVAVEGRGPAGRAPRGHHRD